MKWILMIAIFWHGLLFAGEMEVRSYRVPLSILERAHAEVTYDSEDGEPDPFDADESQIVALQMPVIEKAGFESRFLKGHGKLRDGRQLVAGLAGDGTFAGKAVYDEETGRLVVTAEEGIHDDVFKAVRRAMPLSIMTEVAIYEVPGVNLEGRSGIWEKVPGEAKLLAGLSCSGLPGQMSSARSEKMSFETEVQFDFNDQIVESRLTVTVDLPGRSFQWKTGFAHPAGVGWAHEVGSFDGASTLVMVVKQDLLSVTGVSMDGLVEKENGGAFLKRERLEGMRWKDPELRPEFDLEKPFQVFEVPVTFETFLRQGQSGAKLIRKEDFPELKEEEGDFYELRDFIQANGISFREGDFVVLKKGSAKFFAKLSMENLELLSGLIEAGQPELPRMIRITLTEVEGENFRVGKIHRKLAICGLPGQMATSRFGDGLIFESEAQIDGDDERVEMRVTLSGGDEKADESIFKTGLTARSGHPVVIQESLEKGRRRKWVVVAEVVDFSLAVDEYLKREETEESIRRMRAKMDEIRIPEVNFENVTVEEAIEFLVIRSFEADQDSEVNQRGFGFVVRSPINLEENEEVLGDREDPNEVKISLSVRNQSLAKLLDLVCEKAGLEWKVDEFAITIQPKGTKNPPRRPVVDDPTDPFSESSETDPEDDPFGK